VHLQTAGQKSVARHEQLDPSQIEGIEGKGFQMRAYGSFYSRTVGVSKSDVPAMFCAEDVSA